MGKKSTAHTIHRVVCTFKFSEILQSQFTLVNRARTKVILLLFFCAVISQYGTEKLWSLILFQLMKLIFEFFLFYECSTKIKTLKLFEGYHCTPGWYLNESDKYPYWYTTCIPTLYCTISLYRRPVYNMKFSVATVAVTNPSTKTYVCLWSLLCYKIFQ